MSNKSGLGYSELTGRIYWGLQNNETGMWVGNNKKDVTNMFLQVMEHKFSVDTKTKIEVDGKHTSTIYNLAAGREVIVFDTINPDDIDMSLYNQLSSLAGLSYYDDHGCCEGCSNDIVELCECAELEKRQLMVLRLSKIKGAE